MYGVVFDAMRILPEVLNDIPRRQVAYERIPPWLLPGQWGWSFVLESFRKAL